MGEETSWPAGANGFAEAEFEACLGGVIGRGGGLGGPEANGFPTELEEDDPFGGQTIPLAGESDRVPARTAGGSPRESFRWGCVRG